MPQASQSLEIPDFYQRTFSNTWEAKQSQINKRFMGKSKSVSYDGKEYIFNDVDEVNFNERTERLAQTVLQQMTGSRRKMTKRKFDSHYGFDRDDAEFLGMLASPESELLTQFTRAWSKKWDDAFISALSGTVYGTAVGSDEFATAITFDSTNQEIVSTYDIMNPSSTTQSGLTPDKISAAKKRFEEEEYYMEDGMRFFLAMKPDQKQDLYKYAQAYATSDFSGPIMDWYHGRSNMLFGFETLITNRLPVSSGDVCSCFAWVDDAMRTTADKSEIKYSERPDKSHSRQVSNYAALSAMRRWENGVVRILADQSP